jgi:hypothetical protein
MKQETSNNRSYNIRKPDKDSNVRKDIHFRILSKEELESNRSTAYSYLV